MSSKFIESLLTRKTNKVTTSPLQELTGVEEMLVSGGTCKGGCGQDGPEEKTRPKPTKPTTVKSS